MDPLGTESGITEISSLERWSNTEVPGYSISGDERESRFPCRPDINKKLALWWVTKGCGKKKDVLSSRQYKHLYCIFWRTATKYQVDLVTS